MSTAGKTSEGIIPWPLDGDYSEKIDALARIRKLDPSPSQAKVIKRALFSETSGDLASGLMCAVMHHDGTETVDEDGTHYTSANIEALYKDALSKAAQAENRIALHAGFAQFRPVSSDDGFIQRNDANLLLAKLNSTDDIEEQRALISLLRSRAGWDAEQLLDIYTRWFDDEQRVIAKSDLDFWADAVSQIVKKKKHRADRVRAEATTQLRRVLPRLREAPLRARAIRFITDNLDPCEFRKPIFDALRCDDADVRRQAVSAAAKIGAQGRHEVEQILVSDSDTGVLSTSWDLLCQDAEEQTPVIMRIARNPNVDVVCEILLRRTLSSKDPSILRSAWPALPAPLRSALERRWRSDGEWMKRRFHHPMWRKFLHELFHRNRPDDVASVAAMSWITHPLHEVLGVYDFETISGLRRDDPVEIRTENIMRFGFLADAESHEGIALRELVREWQLDLDDLAELEERFDQDRDNLAESARKLNELAAQVGHDVLVEVRRWATDRERPRFDRLEKQFGPTGKRLALLLKEHERRMQQLTGEGDGSPYWRLREASKKLAKNLPQFGCQFTGMIAPDGVLGEYNPEDHSVTLFSPMIDLASADAARTIDLPMDEISPLARTVVELHELAHAHLHLGRDASQGIWQQPQAASAAFHEALAQSFTHRIVSAMDVPHLQDVLAVMEGWLPPEYRFVEFLDTVDAEQLRSWFVSRRQSEPNRTLEDDVEDVMRAVPGYLRILESTTPHKAPLSFVSDLLPALQAFAADKQDRPKLLHDLLSVVSQGPNAQPILGAFLAGGWPSKDELRWLLHEARVAGPSVGRRPLRFMRESDRNTAINKSKSAAELGIGMALEACKKVLSRDSKPVNRTEGAVEKEQKKEVPSQNPKPDSSPPRRKLNQKRRRKKKKK